MRSFKVRKLKKSQGLCLMGSLGVAIDGNGAYSFTRSESEQGTYRFGPTFNGAGGYAEANIVISITVGILA